MFFITFFIAKRNHFKGLLSTILLQKFHFKAIKS